MDVRTPSKCHITLRMAEIRQDQGAMTLVHRGVALACGAVLQVSRTRAVCWFALSQVAAGKHTLSVFKAAQAILERFTGKVKIQALSLVDWRQSQTFLEHLGFKRIRKTISGKYYLYERAV